MTISTQATLEKRIAKLEKDRIANSAIVMLRSNRQVFDGSTEDFTLRYNEKGYRYSADAVKRFQAAGITVKPPPPLKKADKIASLDARDAVEAREDREMLQDFSVELSAKGAPHTRPKRPLTEYQKLKDRVLAEMHATPGADFTSATSGGAE